MAEGFTWLPNNMNVTPSPSLPRYCNATNVMFSQWDVMFEFSQIVATPPGTPDDAPQVARHVVERLIMSPQHAKAFSQVLSENIKHFEAEHGEIHVAALGDGGTDTDSTKEEVI